MQPLQFTHAGMLRRFLQKSRLPFLRKGGFSFLHQSCKEVLPRRFLAIGAVEPFLQLQQCPMQSRYGQIRLVCPTEALGKPAQQKSHHAQPLVKRCILQLRHRLLGIFPLQNIVHAVIGAIFAVQIQIIRKILCNPAVLQILINQSFLYRQIHILIHLENGRKILPPSRRHKPLAIHRCLHGIKMILANFQIGQNRPMDALLIGIFLPDGKIRLYVDFLHTVKRYHVKFTHAFVVFGRIACRGNQPPFRHLMRPKGLALQKLEHGRRKRFGGTVDFINKQNPLL